MEKSEEKLIEDYPENTCDKCIQWINTRIGTEHDYITNQGRLIGNCKVHRFVCGAKYYCTEFKKNGKNKTVNKNLTK